MLETIKRLTVDRPKKKYTVDGFLLDMGSGHMLSVNQKVHPMYDRFVPFLAQAAENASGRFVIDIGANVGDTAAAMVRHTQKQIICIEPTQKFYGLLQRNINNFGDTYSSRCRTVNAFISADDRENFVSKITAGTAVKVNVDGKAEVPTYTIPSLLKSLQLSLADVSLIKVDTDGFDSDCIMSMGDDLRNASPLLYWENELSDVIQHDKYMAMDSYLEKSGYTDFFVFDNFGNYLSHCTIEQLQDINNYLLRLAKGMSTRTFFYADILGCKPEQREICTNSVKSYLDFVEKSFK